MGPRDFHENFSTNESNENWCTGVVGHIKYRIVKKEQELNLIKI